MLTNADYGAHAVLDRPGCRLHYWTRGPGDSAPLVLMLHGASIDHRVWAPQVDVFAKAFRVLTLDLRGHGLSRPAGDYSFSAIVDDCLALLDAVGADRAIFMGLSMGGNVAQEVVFRSPDRVEALICLDCTCNTLVPRLDRWTLPIYEVLFGPMVYAYPLQPLLKAIADRTCLSPDGRRYVYEASAALTKRELVTVMTSLMAALHHEPHYRVTIPELLLHGSDDKLGNIRKLMPAWRRRDPRSTFVVVPKAGHCANFDNPDFFNNTVIDWLDRAAASDGIGI